MSCPSMINTVAANVSVVADQQGPLGSVVRRFGRNLALDGTGINAMGQGYYDIRASLSFTPTATAPVTIQYYQDGVAIQGASATGQGTAAEPLNLSVVGTARNTCCNPNSAITYTISEAGVINSLSTKIGKE